VRAEPWGNFATKTFVLLLKSLEKCSFSSKPEQPRVGEFVWYPRSPRARDCHPADVDLCVGTPTQGHPRAGEAAGEFTRKAVALP
jgi:hypothetical protein